MTLITDEKAAALVRGLTLKYLDVCEEERVNQGTAAQLLGLSQTRLSQLKKAAREGGEVMIHVGTFLRMRQVLQGVPHAKEEGVLPAKSKKGSAQDAVARYFLGQ